MPTQIFIVVVQNSSLKFLWENRLFGAVNKYKIHCVLTKTPLIRPARRDEKKLLLGDCYYFEEKKSVAAIFGSKLHQKLSDNDDELVSQFPVLRMSYLHQIIANRNR